MKIDELDTPALLIDLDRLEANLLRWQRHCDQLGIRNRPHVKTHKIPELARLQIAHGAAGVTCQKLGEAEAMADGGVDDILLAYNIIGEQKLERLAALHRRINLQTVADSAEVALGLQRAALAAGKPLKVMVECDTGMNRVGVPTPEGAAELARLIRSLDGLEFSGFCTYPASFEAAAFFAKAREVCRHSDVTVPAISMGGTPGMWQHAALPGITEYRVGTYLYNDRIIAAHGDASLADCAATLLVSVVSCTGASWVTIDGGTKTFSSDQYGQTGFGILLDDPDTVVVRCSEEHGVLQRCGEKPSLQVGDRVRVIPNHACIVSNLHDTAYAVRGDDVVAIWKITARGKIQ